MPTNTEANMTSLSGTIVTPSSSAACGVELQTGKEYLLAGTSRVFVVFVKA